MNAAAAYSAERIHQHTSIAVIGAVKSTYPSRRIARTAVNDADFSGAAELDAWARHAFGASGFGDAEVVPAAAGAAADGDGNDAAARQHRSASLVAIVATLGSAVGEALRNAVQRWQQQRRLRRTYLALAGLDERTLKDIGIGSHEAGSVAAELVGRAERTRIQALRTLRELTI